MWWPMPEQRARRPMAHAVSVRPAPILGYRVPTTTTPEPRGSPVHRPRPSVRNRSGHCAHVLGPKHAPVEGTPRSRPICFLSPPLLPPLGGLLSGQSRPQLLSCFSPLARPATLNSSPRHRGITIVLVKTTIERADSQVERTVSTVSTVQQRERWPMIGGPAFQTPSSASSTPTAVPYLPTHEIHHIYNIHIYIYIYTFYASIKYHTTNKQTNYSYFSHRSSTTKIAKKKISKKKKKRGLSGSALDWTFAAQKWFVFQLIAVFRWRKLAVIYEIVFCCFAR